MGKKIILLDDIVKAAKDIEKCDVQTAIRKSDFSKKLDVRMQTTIRDKMIIQERMQLEIKNTIRWEIDTKEEQLRNALITLGWTPPEEE